MSTPIINLGILAHVDAGKTTLTEHLLYNSGAIRNIGSVDKGSTNTDSLAIEKERGISVKAAATSFLWNNTKINIIDTPGHIDFSSDTERALCVLDAAVLVVSAVEAVQSHTINLWDALQKLQIPTFIFVNKIDRQGADFEAVLQQLENDLKLSAVPLYNAVNEGLDNASIQNVFNNSTTQTHYKDKAIESILEHNNALMERYINSEDISDQEYLNNIRELIDTNHIAPIYCGVAKNNLGVVELLDGITNYCTIPKPNVSKKLSAYVFKLEHHKTNGVMAYVKVFSGILTSKSLVKNYTQNIDTKINQTKALENTKLIDNVDLKPGDIGIITGVPGTKAGDILGCFENIPKLPQLHIPVLTVQVTPKKEADYNKLTEALLQIDREDPSLNFKWHKAEQELQLLLMGHMQIEVLSHTLQRRFQLEAHFTPPEVVYKETISDPAEGYIRYWMPKPCWAIMTFLIEPAQLNSGVTYRSIVSQNDIHQKYQNEIERTIPKALAQGLLGWEVTDVTITLIKGEDHNVHSRPGDFNLATPMGIMKGLKSGGTHLLEPILSFSIRTHEQYLGTITSELTSRRAIFNSPEFHDEQFSLTGKIPVATSLDLSIKLNSITSGKNRLLVQFYGYDRCPEGQGKSRDYRGVNPLDEAQWILHRRGAYKADERTI
ncbi:MAG: GTP-binding protein [Flavobacteriaceae bacterium]